MSKAKTFIGIVVIAVIIIVCANYLDSNSIEKEQTAWEQEQIEKYGKTLDQSAKEAEALTEKIEQTNKQFREETKSW